MDGLSPKLATPKPLAEFAGGANGAAFAEHADADAFTDEEGGGEEDDGPPAPSPPPLSSLCSPPPPSVEAEAETRREEEGDGSIEGGGEAEVGPSTPLPSPSPPSPSLPSLVVEEVGGGGRVGGEEGVVSCDYEAAAAAPAVWHDVEALEALVVRPREQSVLGLDDARTLDAILEENDGACDGADFGAACTGGASVQGPGVGNIAEIRAAYDAQLCELLRVANVFEADPTQRLRGKRGADGVLRYADEVEGTVLSRVSGKGRSSSARS